MGEAGEEEMRRCASSRPHLIGFATTEFPAPAVAQPVACPPPLLCLIHFGPSSPILPSPPEDPGGVSFSRSYPLPLFGPRQPEKALDKVTTCEIVPVTSAVALMSWRHDQFLRLIGDR